MNRKIIFCIISILVVLLIVLINLFLKEQNKQMLGIEKSKTNNVIDENNQTEIKNTVYINDNIDVGQDVNVNEKINKTKIIEVNEENFDKEVLNSDKEVLVDFYADWCEPCKMLYPIIEEIAKENENIKVVRINIDSEINLSIQYQIMSIPTMVVIKNGKEINRMIGVNSKENILNLLEQMD